MALDKSRVLTEAQKVFFLAMLAGYLGSGATKEKSADGEVTITWIQGDFRVLDRYYVTPFSTRSGGTTTIFYKEIPVWWMAYGGSYKEEAIPFLKEALALSYEDARFVGGRGPKSHRADGLDYRNVVQGNFAEFRGREEITAYNPRRSLGFHDYWGMSML